MFNCVISFNLYHDPMRFGYFQFALQICPVLCPSRLSHRNGISRLPYLWLPVGFSQGGQKTKVSQSLPFRVTRAGCLSPSAFTATARVCLSLLLPSCPSVLGNGDPALSSPGVVHQPPYFPTLCSFLCK